MYWQYVIYLSCEYGRRDAHRIHFFKALTVKIFSVMPVSMVNECAMSVVTWLNSPRRKQQQVPTMANHLII
jgi:hypothetical protein